MGGNDNSGIPMFGYIACFLIITSVSGYLVWTRAWEHTKLTGMTEEWLNAQRECGLYENANEANTPAGVKACDNYRRLQSKVDQLTKQR